MASMVSANGRTDASSRFLFRDLLTFMTPGSALPRTALSQVPTDLLAHDGSRVPATSHGSTMLTTW
jgi:hypothetical protein